MSGGYGQRAQGVPYQPTATEKRKSVVLGLKIVSYVSPRELHSIHVGLAPRIALIHVRCVVYKINVMTLAEAPGTILCHVHLHVHLRVQNF